ncbi:4-oxalocrotonate tautomerase DmpI [uncultured Clostridium sp.]|uniref:4-oxalocrotonate tautomerase DmpI n=1 Tax=uncultured Clostridium sp. TaxID=59620 RepID=UPI002622CBAC|nr:4-oxalocrotonate tautomerase DmpI [uncultured Clostridium sp.]
MPLITVEIGKISKEQKAALVKELVTKAGEICNIPEEAFLTIIKENDYDNIGNGTKLFSEVIKDRK